MAKEAELAGNVEFRYSYPQARQVFLVGSFNGWNPRSHPLHRRNGEWTCRLQLPPGAYQFNFLAEVNNRDSMGLGGSSWSCSELQFAVVTPRGGSFELAGPSHGDSAEDEQPGTHSGHRAAHSLLPLSRLEAALVRGFRRLPDNESRSAFLDVLQESVYS